MTSSVFTSPQFRLMSQRQASVRDEAVRAQSRSKRAEILEQISRHPDANEGLREQARLYRERLEAGMERDSDR